MPCGPAGELLCDAVDRLCRLQLNTELRLHRALVFVGRTRPVSASKVPVMCCCCSASPASSCAKARMLVCRGHASENPELPTALAATPTQIRFLGPPAAAMAALGDKVGAV